MDKLKDKDLEQISGGDMNPAFGSDPGPRFPDCCDFTKLEIQRWDIVRSEKLYCYCEWCEYWTGDSCEKGHF